MAVPGALDLFPYEPRPHQRELIAAFAAALEKGEHAVVESGTGTGKTACALSAALAQARAQQRRVLYLTRTNSQSRQVVLEYRRIRERAPPSSADARAGIVALQGRQHLCPLRREEPEMREADAEELGTMCRDRMRAAEQTRAGEKPALTPCRYHLRGLEEGVDDLLAWARRESPQAEELVQRVAQEGRCPYVLSRALLPEAEVVVAPYIYYFHPFLRQALLRWMAVAPSDLVIVVDEAHNLAPFARDLASASLGKRTLEAARRETREFGDPDVLPQTSVSRVFDALRDAIDEARLQYVPEGEEDGLLPPDEVDVLLLSALRTSTPMLDRAIVAMEEYGAAVRDAKRRRGKLPRSHVGAVGSFLRAWRAAQPETHARLVEVQGDEARLTAYAVDPSMVTEALLESAGSLHVSGTLEPLEEHRDTIGLPPATRLSRFPSPFPPGNRLVLVDDEVTTRHDDLVRDPSLWDALRERLRALRRSSVRSMAVFAPSHEALRRLAPALEGPGCFIERPGMTQDALMHGLESFRATRGATLASVVGGRVSEGLDFPDDELEIVVVVGLPYGRPTAKQEALVRFHQRRSGRGWEYAVKAPMTRRVLQAAGRLIRTPTDRGVVVLLDRRAAMLRQSLPELRVTDDRAREVAAFFAGGAAAAPAPVDAGWERLAR